MSQSLVLSIEGLNFSYPGRPVLTNVNWSIGPGLSLVCGGEGRGKTSLLRILAGELACDSGTVHLNGMDLHKQRQNFLREVFWADPRSEAHHAINAITWFSNQATRFPRFDRDLCDHLCDGLELNEHLPKPLYMLSTGSRRKVWLAGALASGALLTLIDEPFAALDKRSIRFVTGFLEEASQHATRAWLMADYEAPAGLDIGATCDLGD